MNLRDRGDLRVAAARTSPRSSSRPPRLGKRRATGMAAGEQVLPEDVGVREAVHQLHLPQHVAPVAGQLVHLQHHDLPRLAVPHLEGGAGEAEPLCSTPGHQPAPGTHPSPRRRS